MPLRPRPSAISAGVAIPESSQDRPFPRCRRRRAARQTVPSSGLGSGPAASATPTRPGASSVSASSATSFSRRRVAVGKRDHHDLRPPTPNLGFECGAPDPRHLPDDEDGVDGLSSEQGERPRPSDSHVGTSHPCEYEVSGRGVAEERVPRRDDGLSAADVLPVEVQSLPQPGPSIRSTSGCDRRSGSAAEREPSGRARECTPSFRRMFPTWVRTV